MTSTLILTSPAAMSAPLPGTPVLRLPGDRVTLLADQFTGSNADPLTARSPWLFALNGGFALSGNQLKAASVPVANSMVSEVGRAADIRVSARIVSLPSSGQASLVARRNTVSGATESLSLRFEPGSAQVAYVKDGSTVVLASSRVDAAPGQVWEIREYGGLVEVRRDGALVYENRFPSSWTGPYVGVSSGSATEGWVLDNFSAIETIQ